MRKLIAFLLLSLPLFAQVNSARMLSGVNKVTAASYSFQPSDVSKLNTFVNASPVAATLLSGLNSGFGAGSIFSVVNYGSGTLTINCSGCLIYSNTNPTGSASLQLTTGQGADLYGDGLNFSANAGAGTAGGGSGAPQAALPASPLINQGASTTPVYASGITYHTPAMNWSQTLTIVTLTAGVPNTVSLTPCPVGVDTTSGAGYDIHISGTNSEDPLVTGGSCSSGASSGTIVFTPFFAHSGTYTIGSSSAGLQETINAACGTSATNAMNVQCNLTVPANGPYPGSFTSHSLNDYNVTGTIFLHTNQSFIKGDGVSMNCTGRGPCIQVGDLANANNYMNNTIRGFSFRSPTDFSANSAYAGVKITNTQTTGGFRIITTNSAHNFRPKDLVTILFTDDTAYWGDAQVVDCGTSGGAAVCTGSSTSFRIAAAGTIASQATPGVVALAYEAILDNANNTHFVDIQYDKGGEAGAFNTFFDAWDDENMVIDHFNNNSIPLNGSATWLGSYVFSGGAQNIGHQIAPVITINNATITGGGAGITVFNSNGVYVNQTVIQSTQLWEAYCSNILGNFLGCSFKDLYNNGFGPQFNLASPVKTPFPGTGWSGLISGYSSGVTSISGTGSFPGWIATAGAGATPYTYYIVAHCTGTGNGLGGGTCTVAPGNYTSPMQVLNWVSTGSDAPVVKWPRIANGPDTITYDVIRMTTPNPGAFPSVNNCGGGSGGTCGSVATAITQATACSGGLVCTFTDNANAGALAATTSAYTINRGTYGGPLNFWPGALVVEGTNAQSPIGVDFENPGPIVGIGLAGSPAQVAKLCSQNGQTGPGGYTSCMASVTSPSNAVKNQAATLMTDGPSAGGTASNSKGRLNIIRSPFTPIDPQCIITLVDSEPGLTEATYGFRPLANANDVCIGSDAPASTALNLGQLAFNSPVAITNYIGSTFTGSGYLERLTSTLKLFNVNVQISGANTLALPGLSNGCLNITAGIIGSTGSACGSGGGGFANPMTTAGDMIDGGVVGAAARLAGPTTPNSVAQLLTSTPSGGVAQTPAWLAMGMAGRAITGATSTDTIVSADCTNRAEYVGSVAVGVTLPTATTLVVPACVFKFKNLLSTTNSVTVTPTTWTVNGNATLPVLLGQTAFMHVDPNSATNWQADVYEPAIAAGPGIVLTRSPQTLTVTAAGGAMGIAADYTNATTTLSNVTGLSYAMVTGANYNIDCNLVYQSSASTASLQLAGTGASPSKTTYSLNETLTSGSSPTFYSNAADGTVFTTVLGSSSVATTAADLPATYMVNIRNAASGTWQLQAKAAGAGTVTIKDSSSCNVTQF